MKKLLIIVPHLSTGGAPAVTLNKVKLLKDSFEIKLIEHDFISWVHVVQRNELINLLTADNFYSLNGDKATMLKTIIEDFQPDVISIEEFPEFFMPDDVAAVIYSHDRNYTILESTHDSSFNPNQKRYFPDKFVFVSPYCAFKYNMFNVPMEIIEYPVDDKVITKRIENRDKLGL
jgi:hypothetical protein